MMTFKYASSQLSESDLDEVECRFGFRFPPDFRRLYLQSNGGRPDRDRFVDANGSCIVDAFLPIKYARPPLNLFEKSIEWLKLDQRLVPDHLVQFAVDPFGNLFCFSTKADEFGAIYWFRTERNRARHAEFLSPSLDDFLGRLKAKDEDSRGDGMP